MDIVEELLKNRKWCKRCLRANVAQPEDIVTYGKIKVAMIFSNVLNNREKEPELYDAIKAIAPEWWGDDTQITLNKNLVCKRHRDSCNKEHSWILWLGDFTGGALHFDDGKIVEGPREWHKINGHIHHWNLPHVGNKYSIVIYKGTRKAKTKNLVAGRQRQRQRLREREQEGQAPEGIQSHEMPQN